MHIWTLSIHNINMKKFKEQKSSTPPTIHKSPPTIKKNKNLRFESEILLKYIKSSGPFAERLRYFYHRGIINYFSLRELWGRV